MTDPMLAALAQLEVSLVAVDEAHCISQWGPAFRPEYADLARLRELFPETPIAAMTATADEVTRSDIVAQLFAGDAETHVQGFDRPNIRLSVAAKAGGNRQLLDFLARHEGASGIVYCLSRKKTEATTALLNDHGIRALAYHAGMDKIVRDANQNAFMTDPGTVMVATIAFGMGIDKSDIRFVFHADMPASIEAYYQELGRAGRDGAPAETHMLFGLDDIRMRRIFIEGEDTQVRIVSGVSISGSTRWSATASLRPAGDAHCSPILGKRSTPAATAMSASTRSSSPTAPNSPKWRCRPFTVPASVSAPHTSSTCCGGPRPTR